jgi:hypothetical protein
LLKTSKCNDFFYTFTTLKQKDKSCYNFIFKTIRNMYKKIFYVLGIVIFTLTYGYSQNATLKGKVTDEKGTPVDYANVKIMQEGSLITGSTTGEDGSFTIKPIPTGTFDLVVSFVGCQEKKIVGISFRGSEVKFQDVQINCSSGTLLTEVVIVDTREIFSKDQTESKSTRDGSEIAEMPGKDVSSVLSTMSSVVGSGDNISVRGSRTAPQYIQDGVKMSGSGGIPASALASVSLIAGGIPARYGNATSVVEIETKGPSRSVNGSIDLYGNIEGYNNGGFQFVLSGPINSKKNRARPEEQQNRIGYMITAMGSYSSGGIYRGGTYRAPQELIDKIIENPLRPAVGGGSTAAMNPEIAFVTKDQLTIGKTVQNGESYGGTVSGKLDFRTRANIDIIMNGRFSYSKGRSWSFGNSLFNSKNNAESESMGGLGMIRFTQKFKDTEKSLFKNVYYRIQADYQFSTGQTYNKYHKTNIFDYGYIGQFIHSERKFYNIGSDTLDGHFYENVRILSSYYYPLDTFIASDKNPALARYTELAYNQLREDGATTIFDEHIQTYNGLLNGEHPSSAYGLFVAPGVGYSSYGKSRGHQFGFNAYVSFDIKKDHAIELGYQFEQSISQSFSVGATGLWTLMRQKANSHIKELDATTGIGVFIDGIFVDTINYKKLINYGAQSTFDKNLRAKLGAAEDEWIDIDNHQPETYSLDMFSAEELINEGNSYIGYSGYDFTGTKLRYKPTTMEDMKKWFNDSNSQILSDIGASMPIYHAAYIQDKFSIRNLIFNVGLRVDIFDANTPMVKDMYLYREAYTIKEAKQQNATFAEGYKVPESMGDDYIMYVLDPTANELTVTAYRNGTTWYDAQGNIVTDPNELAKAVGETSLLPYLKEMPGASDKTKVNWKAFKDYSPTLENGGITLSPRLSFSFNVSDESVFYAHYNVTTQRQYSTVSPITYFYMKEGSTISNTGLRPSKSIDYEIGFKQRIGKDMALFLSAYYSEKRDQAQMFRYAQAYPFTYYSYANIDFGTTQGFVVSLDMNRIKYVRLTANYTLQFAKGTGSSAASNLAIIATGQPNLRTLTNLSFDQRHMLNANLSFSVGPKQGYSSKHVVKKTNTQKEIYWFQNAGINITAKVASGLPYTRSSTMRSITGQGIETVSGSIYGSRMPWQYTLDMKIYKVFLFDVNKNKENKKQKLTQLQVYLDIWNIFNFKNITSVYPYTGNALDDGFLTDADFQNYINSQLSAQSFIDYYTIYMETGRIGYPRRFTLGVSFNF